MSRIRRRSTGSKGWDQLVPDVQRRQNKQAQIAANRVLASVFEISPNYSGRFRTRWEAQPIGLSVEPSQEGGLAPALQGFAEGRGYSIRNNSPYAAQAMDLEPGVWIKPKGQPAPKGDIVVEGFRDPGFTMRGDVEESPYGGSVSTAERDWYENYARSQFGKDVRAGAQSAVVRRPR